MGVVLPMRYIVIASMALAAGCSAGIPNDPTESALAVAWEGTYQMERDSRPRVVWFDDACRTDTGVDQREQHATVFAADCIVAVVGNDGLMQLKRAAAPSASQFPHALGLWRQWLLATTFKADPLAGQAKADLLSAGL